MAKINSATKSINAVFVNINLLRLIIKLSDLANILLALSVASLRFFITIIPIILMILFRERIPFYSAYFYLSYTYNLCISG